MAESILSEVKELPPRFCRAIHLHNICLIRNIFTLLLAVKFSLRLFGPGGNREGAYLVGSRGIPPTFLSRYPFTQH